MHALFDGVLFYSFAMCVFTCLGVCMFSCVCVYLFHSISFLYSPMHIYIYVYIHLLYIYIIGIIISSIIRNLTENIRIDFYLYICIVIMIYALLVEWVFSKRPLAI